MKSQVLLTCPDCGAKVSIFMPVENEKQIPWCENCGELQGNNSNPLLHEELRVLRQAKAGSGAPL